MCMDFETSDIEDITEDIECDIEDITEGIECDIEDISDSTSEIDDMLDGMSLDELYDLRDSLNSNDLPDPGDEIPDISDLTPIDEDPPSDYSFHWDGEATHNTEWDELPDPTSYTKVRTR